MKKALVGALFGGLVIFAVPHAFASNGTAPGHVVVTHETGSGDSDAGCATMTQGSADQPKQDAPGEGRSHYDKEHHDGDVF